MNNPTDPAVHYQEVQHFPPFFHALLGAVMALLLWGQVSALVFHKPFGAKPAPPAVLLAMWLFFVALYLVVFRLVVRVDDQGVTAEYGYLGWVKFRWRREQLRRCEATTYRPLRDFGGWGIRFGAGGTRCYSARGNRGVLLETDKRRVILGSQRPEELAAAIRALIDGTPVTGRSEARPPGSR